MLNKQMPLGTVDKVFSGLSRPQFIRYGCYSHLQQSIDKVFVGFCACFCASSILSTAGCSCKLGLRAGRSASSLALLAARPALSLRSRVADGGISAGQANSSCSTRLIFWLNPKFALSCFLFDFFEVFCWLRKRTEHRDRLSNSLYFFFILQVKSVM